MSPQMKLSKFANVVVGGRMSRSGDALPQSGDLVGQIGPVANGSVKLVLTKTWSIPERKSRRPVCG